MLPHGRLLDQSNESAALGLPLERGRDTFAYCRGGAGRQRESHRRAQHGRKPEQRPRAGGLRQRSRRSSWGRHWPPAAVADADRCRAAPDAPPRPAGAAARVACTSCSVTTLGGIDVMMVALSRSPCRKSETCAGLPARMIFTPRLSTSLCVNDRMPSSVRTMIVDPAD